VLGLFVALGEVTPPTAAAKLGWESTPMVREYGV